LSSLDHEVSKNVKPKVVGGFAPQVHLLPTILDIAGVHEAREIDGQSLRLI